MIKQSSQVTSNRPQSPERSLEGRRDELLAAFSDSIQLFLATAEHFPRHLVRSRPRHEPEHDLAEGVVEKRPFTATEIVYHMIDVEALWQFRMQGLLNGTLNLFQQINPDRLAVEKKYNTRDFVRGIRELAHAREETTKLVASMTEEQLALEGVHSRYGEMNIIRILEIMESHDRQHAAQLDRTLDSVRI